MQRFPKSGEQANRDAEVGGRVRRHVPDFLLGVRNGGVRVVNVKPADRLSDPMIAAVLARPGELFRTHGWDALVPWSTHPAMVALQTGPGRATGTAHLPSARPALDLSTTQHFTDRLPAQILAISPHFQDHPPTLTHVRQQSPSISSVPASWTAITTPTIRKWARKNKVELCLTPANASWANPIGAQFGPLRTFVMGDSNHPNHTVLARWLHAYLRWRNANARHPDVLAAQRRERARIRSERRPEAEGCVIDPSERSQRFLPLRYG